mmetsp:Transcript_3256/g.8415  ORF Transcript_3256/g.8415 Transcript_3256/m.8415 type:complete len:81 (-) Transcript_3256:1957-2199(-)
MSASAKMSQRSASYYTDEEEEEEEEEDEDEDDEDDDEEDDREADLLSWRVANAFAPCCFGPASARDAFRAPWFFFEGPFD